MTPAASPAGPARAWVAVVAALLVVALIVGFADAQFVETRLTAALLRWSTGWRIVTTKALPVFYFPTSRPPGQSAFAGLELTPECSVLLMVIPVILLGGVIGSVRRFALRRVVLATAVAVAVMVLANQVRLGCIVMCIRWLGDAEGYNISHTYVGSLVALAGFTAGMGLFAKLVAHSGSARQTEARP